MALEKFFDEGNKVSVFGSFVYLREYASDLDLTLFTRQQSLPFYPEYSEEVMQFLEDNFGRIDLPIDFTGRRDKVGKVPYDLSNLPADDRRLDGYLLTCVFFPDNSFLETHYKSMMGEDYLAKTWLRHAEDIQRNGLQEARLNKKNKDLALLLKSTEKVANNTHPYLWEIIGEFSEKHISYRRMYASGNINIIEYDRRLGDMIPEFVSSVKSRLIN